MNTVNRNTVAIRHKS